MIMILFTFYFVLNLICCYSKNIDLKLLSNHKNAICMDGSSAGFYIEKGYSHHWILNLEGIYKYLI